MEIRLPWLQSLLTTIITTWLITDSSEAKPNIEKQCSTCREVTQSFNEGIERTARFNFEGGDTDWEEKKLGSYSTSETRFIEILETLCKRTDYECNVFVEQVEELLEKWWNNHDRDNDDFERWLCIENAVVCCHKNRYGPDCEECTGGLDRPCSGNGNCKGEGTRGGSGKCKCHGGYKGDLCDVCKKGFYEEFKNETDISCTACDSSCSSTCSGPGPKACTKCKGGYSWDDEAGCQDIDECKFEQERYPCQKQQYCENSQGSFTCANCDIACTECLGPGNDKCIACRTGFHMMENICRDVDECENNPCKNVEHMVCDNSPGSYFCECEEGYISDGEYCVDKTILTTDEIKALSEIIKVEHDDSEPMTHDKSPDTMGLNLPDSTAEEGETIATREIDSSTGNQDGTSHDKSPDLVGQGSSEIIIEENQNDDVTMETSANSIQESQTEENNKNKSEDKDESRDEVKSRFNEEMEPNIQESFEKSHNEL